MSLPSSIRFFYFGKPGFILVVVLGILGVGLILKNGADKRAAEAEKKQKTRELGKVSPAEPVDASQASKEAVISSRRLSPGFTTSPEAAPIPNAAVTQQGRQQALPTLVSFYAQVQATPSPTPTPELTPQRPETWLPPGVFIPCSLVNTVDSARLNTPVVAEVIRDVFENGHLIIPAGSIMNAFAQSGAVRDRIEVAGVWVLVFPDGKQLRFRGVACDREADVSNQQFGINDGSAGLQGEIVESDKYGQAKALLALLLTTGTQAVTALANGAVSHGITGVQLPDTTPILETYLSQLLNGTEGDARFVRVCSSKELYVVNTEVVYPARRTVSDQQLKEDKEQDPESRMSPEMQSAIEQGREVMRGIQPQPEPTPPRMHY
jgi:Bacterial conjugation TrbI-like protein